MFPHEQTEIRRVERRVVFCLIWMVHILWVDSLHITMKDRYNCLFLWIFLNAHEQTEIRRVGRRVILFFYMGKSRNG